MPEFALKCYFQPLNIHSKGIFIIILLHTIEEIVIFQIMRHCLIMQANSWDVIGKRYVFFFFIFIAKILKRIIFCPDSGRKQDNHDA